jgi:hypothetical protein
MIVMPGAPGLAAVARPGREPDARRMSQKDDKEETISCDGSGEVATPRSRKTAETWGTRPAMR